MFYRPNLQRIAKFAREVPDWDFVRDGVPESLGITPDVLTEEILAEVGEPAAKQAHPDLAMSETRTIHIKAGVAHRG